MVDLFEGSGVKAHKAIDRTEVERAIVFFVTRFVVELVCFQSVVYGVVLKGLCSGIEAYDASVGREPKVAFVVLLYLVYDVVSQPIEGIEGGKGGALWIETCKACAFGSDPDLLFRVLKKASGLVIREATGVFGVMEEMLPMVCGGVVYKKTFVEGCHIDIAIGELFDVLYGNAIELLYGCELLGEGVEGVYP